MALNIDDIYFGIKEQLGEAGVSAQQMNQLLIYQLASLSKRDWFDMRDVFTKEELVEIIVRLLDEIGNLKEELEGG